MEELVSAKRQDPTTSPSSLFSTLKELGYIYQD